MKLIATILIALCMAAPAGAQVDTSFRLMGRITGDIVSFTVDNLDNIYLVNSTNQVKKLNANGDSVAVFNDVKRYGQATLIDVSNPLKVLVYYRDFGTIVILDRFLNVRSSIDLRKENILQVRAIGQSYDNKIWVFDEVENKLKKIDDDGRVLLETPDFRQLFDAAIVPQKIFDHNQHVYLYDSLQPVCVFDYYGALKKKILISHWQNFKVAGNYIFGSKGTSLFRYDLKTFRLDEWRLAGEIIGAKSFNFTGSRLYALRNDRIDVFNFR